MTSPQPLTQCMKRDHTYNNHNWARTEIARTFAENDTMAHELEDLDRLYSAAPPAHWELSALGFEGTADLLASEIPFDFPVSSYLDLGTGTGPTALACGRALLRLSRSFVMFLADGLDFMLDRALIKVYQEFSSQPSFQGVIVTRGDILGTFDRVRNSVLKQQDATTVSLITAQRVFLTVKKDRRVQQLKDWAGFLEPGGRLILDIPHPNRKCGAVFIGLRDLPTGVHVRPPLEICRLIGDEATWEECRDYARALGHSAGLVIKNQMPKHLPQRDQQNGHPDFLSWLEGCRAASLTDPLSRDEITLFTNRYASAAINHYAQQSYLCTADIAAVVTVFELPSGPLASASTPIQSVPRHHTKYQIDDSLHGEARKKAIKSAAKAAKKEASTKTPRKEDGSNEDGENGSAGMIA